MPWTIRALIEPGSNDEDRCLVHGRGRSWRIAIADGAGGVGRGALAAERVIGRASVERLATPRDAKAALSALDRDLHRVGAMASALVFEVDEHGQLWGATGGDCSLWTRWSSGWLERAGSHCRQPLGSGRAVPLMLGPMEVTGFLAGSDGLFRYVDADALLDAVDSGADPAELVAMARLPTGGVRDDTTVVIGQRGVDGRW